MKSDNAEDMHVSIPLDADSSAERIFQSVMKASRSLQARVQKGKAVNSSYFPEFGILKDIQGLDATVKRIREEYERKNFKNAAQIARTAHDIIAPTLDAVSGKPFSIEIKYARNISLVYCMLAEECWGSKDYEKALSYMDTAIYLWAGNPPGDLVAMRVAILINICRRSVIIINDDILRYAEAGGRMFMSTYIARLKHWGYVQDVAIDLQLHRPVHYSYSQAFGKPPYELPGPGVMKFTWPEVEGKATPKWPFYIVMRYTGMGQHEAGVLPQPRPEDDKMSTRSRILLVSTGVVDPATNNGFDCISLIKPMRDTMRKTVK